MKTRYELIDLIISVVAVVVVLAFIGAMVYATTLAKAGLI